MRMFPFIYLALFGVILVPIVPRSAHQLSMKLYFPCIVIALIEFVVAVLESLVM